MIPLLEPDSVILVNLKLAINLQIHYDAVSMVFHEMKRLFFALEIHAPWQQKLPAGRLLDESHRHMTLAFLGHADYSVLKRILNSFPTPPFKVGLAGKFDRCLFLPKKHSKVVAWHVDWLEQTALIPPYQQSLISWLKFHGFKPDEREVFLPHVTIGRAPFNREEWHQNFIPLPMTAQNIHLYESMGNLVYQPIWTFPLIAPFQEFEHTADVAFKVYGETLEQLQKHAWIALVFKFPELLNYCVELSKVESINGIVAGLNRVISRADEKIGCPFKAVSYHGDVKEETDGVFAWEMIVDV